MSAVVSGLIGGVISMGLVALAERSRKGAALSWEGWNTLRPGWLPKVAIAGCAMMAAFPASFLIGGGSSLPDAQSQNLAALLVMLAFGAGAVLIAWLVFGRTIAWRDGELRVRSFTGHEIVRRFADVVWVSRSARLGACRLGFRDGSTLWVPANLDGLDALLRLLPKAYDLD